MTLWLHCVLFGGGLMVLVMGSDTKKPLWANTLALLGGSTLVSWSLWPLGNLFGF